MSRPIVLVSLILLIASVSSVFAQVRPNEYWGYPELVWHRSMKQPMLNRIAQFEAISEMQNRFSPMDFSRMRELASGERISSESPTFPADMDLMVRMRNSSLFLLDSYVLLIRDGQIMSLQDAVRIMNDERASYEMLKPLLFSQVKLDWRECPDCYMEYFRAIQHSMFHDAHDAFVMMVHKFGFSDLPDSAVSEYIQYVADDNLLASLMSTSPMWLEKHSIQPVTPAEMVNRIFLLPRGREIVMEGLARSGSAASNEGGLPRPLRFGSIPGTGYYQTESWEIILDMLLEKSTTPREQIRHVSSLYSHVSQSVNLEVKKGLSGTEFVYSSFLIPTPLGFDELSELRANRIERSREILVILGGRTAAEEFEELDPDVQTPPLLP